MLYVNILRFLSLKAYFFYLVVFPNFKEFLIHSTQIYFKGSLLSLQ